MWFQKEISKTHLTRKIGVGPLMLKASLCDKFIIQMGTTNIGFSSDQVEIWFNPQFLYIGLFALITFPLNSNCLQNILIYIYLLRRNS